MKNSLPESLSIPHGGPLGCHHRNPAAYLQRQPNEKASGQRSGERDEMPDGKKTLSVLGQSTAQHHPDPATEDILNILKTITDPVCETQLDASDVSAAIRRSQHAAGAEMGLELKQNALTAGVRVAGYLAPAEKETRYGWK